MAFNLVLLGLVSVVALSQGYRLRDYNTEEAAVDDRSAYDKNKNANFEWGVSDGKKVSFSNQQRTDESGLTNEENLKQGPRYITDGHGRGHVYYDGGLEYNKKLGDVRKSSDGKTAYDASDIKAEVNRRNAADTDRGYRYLKGASGKNRKYQYDSGPYYNRPYEY